MSIPEGTWKVRACEGALGTTNKTDREQVAVDLEIMDGPALGAHITWYGFFTDKTFDRTIESLRLLGWQGHDLSDLRGLGSTEATAVIADEPDENGEVRTRVKWINAIGGIAMKNRMDIGAAKAFAERMKGRVLAQSQQAPNATQRGATERRPSSQQDDNIPF